MCRRLFYITFLFLALSCAKEPDSLPETLVVEGWIDEGGYPVVCVTTSLARPEGHHEVTDLYGHIVRGAQVSVSDGTRSVGLVGRPSSDNFPPYVYSTVRMKGEAGKTYTLTVIANGMTATATTTIPARQELRDIEVIGPADSYKLNCSFRSDGESWYGFFEKDESGHGWSPVFLGLINGKETSGEQTVTITRGSGLTYLGDYAPGFKYGETVSVKFCTMEEDIWYWWKSFHEVTGLSFIMDYPVEDNLPSNMKGAYGYWAGYGAATYTITMPQR